MNDFFTEMIDEKEKNIRNLQKFQISKLINVGWNASRYPGVS